MSRGLLLILVLLLVASSVMMVESASAQSIPKPSVPQFTVKLTEHSLDTPITYSTDPYTGENITHPAVHYEWETIDISIKNQPSDYELSFIIRMKGHFSKDWSVVATLGVYESSKTTNVSFLLKNQTYPKSVSWLTMLEIPENSTVDFQVKAKTGYETRDPTTFWWTWVGAESDWSNTQTITINEGASASTPDTSPSSSSTTHQQDTQTGTLFVLQAALVVLALAVAVLALAVVVLWRKVASK